MFIEDIFAVFQFSLHNAMKQAISNIQAQELCGKKMEKTERWRKKTSGKLSPALFQKEKAAHAHP